MAEMTERMNFWQAVHDDSGPLLTLRVYVYQRPHMRDEALEYELHMGRTVLDDCFDNFKERTDVVNLTLAFPENWLNIIEQRVLYERLWHYCPNLRRLTIKTQSVYIIQMTPHGLVSIVRDPKYVDTPLPAETDPINKRLWEPMIGNIFDMNKLNIL